MKKIEPKALEKVIKATDAAFKETVLTKILDVLKQYLAEETLAGANAALADRNRRKLTYEDLANIAYVHIHSIRENNGQSPYDRIISWCRKNGVEYDNAHIRLATETLLQMELIKLEDAQTTKGKCRKYSIPADVNTALGIPTPKCKL